MTKGLQAGDFAAFCTPPTWPLLAKAQQLGLNWYYGDHAFYRRGRYYRITKNARQYVPTPAAIFSARAHRFSTLGVKVEPQWKTDGRSIVICPNSALYMSQFGLDAHAWATDVAKTLRAHTDRPIIIRWKTDASKRPLAVDLQDAWAVVVYNSNAAVEALCAGVPIFTLCPWAATTPMASADLSKIESPVYPDLRVLYLWDLANHQWTMKEIETGVAWRALNA